MDEIFARNIPNSLDKLKNATVSIAGVGGIGSNVSVSLVRAGIHKLIIADMDLVEISNLNRQHYFQNDIGKIKVDALETHLLNINPDLHIVKHHKKLNQSNMKELLGNGDYLIEGFDNAKEKKWLIETWTKTYPQKPIIAASGLSGFGKSDLLKIKSSGNIHICGDQKSDIAEGLCAPRISIVSNMQANKLIELILKGPKK